MTGDFSVFPSELTMLCGTSSWLTQVTVVPAGTVSVSGAKLKLSILIWYWSLEPFCSPAAGLAWLAFDKPKDRTSKAAADALRSTFFIFLYTPIGYLVLRAYFKLTRWITPTMNRRWPGYACLPRNGRSLIRASSATARPAPSWVLGRAPCRDEVAERPWRLQCER